MVADGLLHAAFEGLVGGGHGQEEVPGGGLPLGEDLLSAPHLRPWSGRSPLFSSSVLLLRLALRGGDGGVKEGNGRIREEAGGWEVLKSCGEAKEVLQGNRALPHWGGRSRRRSEDKTGVRCPVGWYSRSVELHATGRLQYLHTPAGGVSRRR